MNSSLLTPKKFTGSLQDHCFKYEQKRHLEAKIPKWHGQGTDWHIMSYSKNHTGNDIYYNILVVYWWNTGDILIIYCITILITADMLVICWWCAGDRLVLYWRIRDYCYRWDFLILVIHWYYPGKSLMYWWYAGKYYAYAMLMCIRVVYPALLGHETACDDTEMIWTLQDPFSLGCCVLHVLPLWKISWVQNFWHPVICATANAPQPNWNLSLLSDLAGIVWWPCGQRSC